MKSSDLRSNHVRALIYIFAFISALGFIIPITSHYTDTTIWVDTIGIEKNGSIGLGVIMVATTGGIGMAFVVKRRFMFTYYENCYCKKTGEQMYEDENHERLFCPSHGEQKMEWESPDDRHYEYLTKEQHEESIQAKAIGKKYHESQETARKSMSKWTRESPSSYNSRSTIDQLTHAGHTHGLSASGGSGHRNKKETKQDLEDKIGTLNEKLASLDRQLQEGKEKKERERKRNSDDDDDLLGLGLLGL